MHELLIEYGDGKMPVAVPDSTIVVNPGVTTQDPPAIDPVIATREAVRNPCDSPPLRELVKRGTRVVIAFPDRVKGGVHPDAHRRISIPILVDELEAAGVRHKDVKLVCAIGLHRKNNEQEFREYLGDDIVKQFWPDRLVCHDAENPEGIVCFDSDELGDVVECNRDVAEADLAIMIGHVTGNPYGGYSGGYKMPATGLTTWRSIRSHHNPQTMGRSDFLPASTHSHFRHQLRCIGAKIEACTQRKFFSVDAVLDTASRVVGVFAGNPSAVERQSWPLAERRTITFVPSRADVLVVGLPRSFHYGPGMGTNPILLLQAIAATLVRCFGVFRKGGVIIAASECDGWFNEEWFPAYQEIFDLIRSEGRAALPRHETKLATRPEYISAYRDRFAYHPFHGFSMAYLGSLALQHAGAVIIVGAKRPEFAEAMGCRTAPSFADALRQAEQHVGKNPRLLVLQEFLTKVPVHLRTQEVSRHDD